MLHRTHVSTCFSTSRFSSVQLEREWPIWSQLEHLVTNPSMMKPASARRSLFSSALVGQPSLNLARRGSADHWMETANFWSLTPWKLTIVWVVEISCCLAIRNVLKPASRNVVSSSWRLSSGNAFAYCRMACQVLSVMFRGIIKVCQHIQT